MLFESGGMIVPSFALAAAAAALNTDPVLGKDVVKLRARSVALDLGYHLPLRFYGPSGSFREFGAWRAINGELEPDDVRGQVVVVGATATGTGDRFATPFDRVTPGVEIFATAISNLLAGDGLTRDGITRGIDAVIAVALPAAAVLLLALRPLWLAIVLTTSAFVAWIVALVVAFTQGYWLSFAIPAAAAVPVAVTYGVGRLWVEQLSNTPSSALRRKPKCCDDSRRQACWPCSSRIPSSWRSRCASRPRSCSWTSPASPA
jgi:adenylate cyclase